ncbi:MAG: crossover junction endodeoxyribonuclease RuvC [Proteobacteria bacterium]|nr:crossover junction endodeoxyribonuclease RuvC [Pseudomonadota bacterium]MBU1714621.1 crossover junction endodeoxyribonuclease RuvC [Pseudomonadota bacterium]
MRSFRILGIDPGSRVTGYGLIDKAGDQLHFIACGVIKASLKMSFPDRLKEIHDGISEVILKHHPDRAAIEDVFVSVNPRSALKLGHARGVLILAAMQHGLPVAEFMPRVIKQAVAGYGQASKEQVQQMVRVMLSLSANPSKDASDALAVAICHANHFKSIG